MAKRWTRRLIGALPALCALGAAAASFASVADAGTSPLVEPPGVAAERAEVVAEGPALLGAAEIAELRGHEPRLGARERLRDILTTPFVHRRTRAGVPVPTTAGPDRPLRVVSWNIRQGTEIDDVIAAFTSPRDFVARTRDAQGHVPERLRDVGEELAHLRGADVLVLQEVDWGVARTGHRAIPDELGEALGMHWAFGAQFLELGGGPRQRDSTLPASRTQSLHGMMVLSRFPIREARLIPLEVQGYDWYAQELRAASSLENLRTWAGGAVFGLETGPQVRRGGRALLLVELDVPAVPGGRLTVAAVHLEGRCSAELRRRQMQEILERLAPLDGPVVVAGDLNTSGHDATPWTWTGQLTARLSSGGFWSGLARRLVLGVGVLADGASAALNFFRTHRDPTAAHLPILAPSPESKLFGDLRSFRFDDGGTFDFRGDPRRSWNGRSGTLANSNERARKGFAGTHAFDRTIGPAGSFKLDWIFVKPGTPDSGTLEGSEVSEPLAPRHGRTLRLINEAAPGRISDHHPISVDLPLMPRDHDALF